MNYSGDHGGRFSADGLAIATDVGPIHFDPDKSGSAHAGVDAITIPDAHLLFSGDFKRAGLDLVLSNENQRYVVHDYFKGDKQASLRSADGATLSASVIKALSGYTVYAQAAPDAAGGRIIGHVLKMSGSASAIRNGVTVELTNGDAVLKGDVIQTGSDSSVGITFIDGSAFGMNANARMVLNEMVYDPGGSSNSSLISLVQGTVTFVAGQTAKNGNMRVETPVATMGIRGTAVLVEIGADNGPTKFSVLVEPDGTTGSYNLYDNSNGQLIGTISQAGQVTLVTSNGTNPVTYSQQAKTQADQQQEKALVQQVFQLYFPSFVPDQDAKPNSNKSGSNGSSGNSLATGTTPDKTSTGSSLGILTIEVKTNVVDPKTGQTTTTSVVYTNTPAIFSTTPAFGGQNFVAPNDGFNIADHVTIYDPDIGTAPFFDVATPFVAGTASFTHAVSSIPLPGGFDLYGLVHVDETTGHVSYTPQTFNFLNSGETVIYTLEFDSRSGPTTSHLSIQFTVTGADDAPVFTVTPVALNVAEIGDQTSPNPQHAQSGQSTTISTPVVINFTDPDFTDLGANYHVAVTNVTSSGSTAGLQSNATALKNELLSFFKFDPTTPVTKNLDETTGHIDGTFSATDATFDYLADGQTLVITYTVQITDPENASAVLTKDFTVTVTGSNDTPVLVADTGSHGIFESTPANLITVSGVSNLSVTGTLAFTDVDLIDTHSAPSPTAATSVTWLKPDLTSGGTVPLATLAALAGALSTTISGDSANGATGHVAWSFKLPDSLADFLAQDETLTIQYTVTLSDGHTDGTVTQPVTIVITGTNDAPVAVADTDQGHIVEAGNNIDDTYFAGTPTTTGNVLTNDTDLDKNDTHSVVGVAAGTQTGALSAGVGAQINGTYGSVVVNADGTWTYTLDNTKTATNALAAGQAASDVFSYTDSDNHGAASTTTLTIGITGTNDAPVTNSAPGAVADTNTTPVVAQGIGLNNAVIAGTATATGNVLTNDFDVDANDTKTVQGVASGALPATPLTDHVGNGVTGTYGSVTIGSDGSWTYTLDNTKTATQALQQGEHASDVFSYTMRDTAGATSSATLTIDVTGTNDAPVITNAAAVLAGTVKEDTTLIATGQLSASDIDHNATQAWSIQSSNTGTYGSIAVDNTGKWTYTLNNGTDGVASAVQSLAAGETHNETFTVRVTDDQGAYVDQTVVVTVNGTNDAPVVTTTSATFAEPSGTANTFSDTATGTISFTDVDLTDRPTVSAAFASYTYFAADHTTALMLSSTQETAIETALALVPSTGNTNNGSSAWTYTVADSALDFLAAGETLTLTYNATVNDANGGIVTKPLTVTITGTNDAPVIDQGAETANVADGGTAFVTGQFFTATDPDHVDTQTWTVEGGSCVVSGTFQFAIDEFKVVKVINNVPTTTFDDTFSGTAPPSGPGGTYVVAGGSFVTDAANGLVDIDSGQAKFVGLSAAASTNGQPVFGEFATLQTNINSNSPTNGLRSGQTFSASGLFSNVVPANSDEFYGIRLSDRLYGATVGAGIPLDQPGSQNVQLAIVQTALGTAAVQFNQIDFTTNISTVLGTWDVDTLYPNDEIRLTLSHNASTNGEVFGSVALVNSSGTVDETYTFSATGQIFANEDWTRAQFFGRSVAEASTAPTADSVLAGTYGTLDIDQTGHWSYALNDGLAATKALAAGQSAQDVFHIDVTDASHATSTQTVTINVAGINDAPAFSGSAIGGAGSGYTENGAPVGIVAAQGLIVSDVDNTNFNGGSFTAAITAGSHTGDTLSVGTTSHIMLDPNGTTVLFDADGTGQTASFVSIGTLTANGNSLSIALNSTADAAAVMELTTAIQFSSTSDNPTADQRTITFALKDGSGTANGGHDTTSFNVPLSVTPVDDAPVAVADTITNAAPPSGWVLDTDNGHYYRYVEDLGHGVSWTNAQAAATADGGYLATVTSSQESTFVYNLIADHTYGGTWIGGYGPTAADASSWYWTGGPEQGAHLTFTNWNVGEPNGDSVYTDAGLFINPDGTWNDVPTPSTDRFGGFGYVEEWGGQAGQVVFRENTGTTLTTAQLLANDTDVDNTSAQLSITAVNASNNGSTVTLNGNIITYHPAANFNGADSFTYTLSDGSLTSTGTVSFNVAAVNDAPVVAFDTGYLKFNGSGYAATPAITTQTDNVTLEGWVRSDGSGVPGTNQVLIYNGHTSYDGFGLFSTVNADGTIELKALIANGGGILDFGKSIAPNEWHHVALVSSGGASAEVVTLYLDGVFVGTQASLIGIINPIAPGDQTFVGGNPNNPNEGFHGDIGNVQIWTVALSQSQIASQQYTIPAGSESGLVGYWPLTDGSGTTAIDPANASQNLTVTNSVFATADGWPAANASAVIATSEDTPLTLAALHVFDVDDNGGTEQVTLSVGHGTLSLGSGSGVTVDQTNDGSTGTLSFTGTIAALNAALLSGVTYAPAANYSGTDTLHVAINDEGNTGSGGALSATQDVSINVSAPTGTTLTDTFTGGTSGTGTDWATATNWSLGRVPDATDIVSIGSAHVVYAAGVTILANEIDIDGTGSTLQLYNATLEGTTLKATDLASTGAVGVVEILPSTSETIFDGTSSRVLIEPGTTVTIDQSATLVLKGTVQDAGTIVVDPTNGPSTLAISGSVTLNGGGSVSLTSSTSTVTSFNDGHGTTGTLTIEHAGVIGSGHLGDGNLNIDNQSISSITAIAQDSLVIDTGTGTFSNEGLILAHPGGQIAIDSAIVNTAVRDSTYEIGIEARSGSITLNGAVTGGGSAIITDSGTMEFGTASDSHVAFSGNTNGTLVLDDPSDFTGTISGIAGGDTIKLGAVSATTVQNNTDSVQFNYATGPVNSLVVANYAAADNSTHTLTGTSGNDVFIGGPGQDSFVFNSTFGKDTITNFTVGPDALQFSSATFTDAATALAHTADVNGHAVVTDAGGDSVALIGVTTAQLHQTDFHIV